MRCARRARPPLPACRPGGGDVCSPRGPAEAAEQGQAAVRQRQLARAGGAEVGGKSAAHRLKVRTPTGHCPSCRRSRRCRGRGTAATRGSLSWQLLRRPQSFASPPQPRSDPGGRAHGSCQRQRCGAQSMGCAGRGRGATVQADAACQGAALVSCSGGALVWMVGLTVCRESVCV